MSFIKTTKGIIISDTAKEKESEIIKNSINALLGDPVSALEMIRDIKSFPSAVRDGIFMECFQVFILNSCEYDVERQEFVDKTLSSFAAALAEVSPNQETDYKGDPDRLIEYAKRIVKMIDDCGTVQKAYYLACLARAVRAKQISSIEFFKFSHCIRSLTEEDLIFLKENITQEIIDTDEEYIDDFRALGLMKDVDGGFAYSKRAFLLVKYALDYEGKMTLPETYPERFTPISVTSIDGGDVKALFEENKDKIIDEAVEKSATKWNTF